MNWLKKVLSLLIAIALLVSAGALAFAEAAAAEAAAQQAAAEAAAQEAEPVPSYNNSEDTSDVNDVPAANDEPAVIDAPVVNDEPVAEDVPAANNEPVVNDVPTTNDEPAANDAPTADDDVDDPNDPTIIFIDDDDKGHTDQETVKELGLEMTDDIVFADAITLSLNAPASAGIDAENRAEFLFTAESDMTVVLGLEASSEAVDVRINGDAVHFTKIAGTEYDGGLNALCELNLTAGKYDIILTSSYNVYVTLTAMDSATAQAKVDAIAAAKAEANNVPAVVSNEENNENTDGENEGNTDTDTNLEGNVNAGNENNTDENTTEEEVIPPMVGWITVDTESYGIGSTITLTAASESELGEMVAWQTKVGGEDWKGAGYGSTLTVELNEENINSSFRFRMEDGNYSAEYTLNPVEVKAEEADETEEPETVKETAEGTDETETTEETETTDGTEETEVNEEETDETEEVEETEEDRMTALGCTKVTVTAEEGADLYAETNKESEVVGHLDAKTEIWVILNEDGTWAKIYTEDEEAAAQFISLEDAEIALSEEAAEETEEAEETEDEKMTVLGCTKVIVTAEEGADLYAEADKESEVVGHLDAETEIWVILNEDGTWAKIYTEDEEAAAQYISLEDAEIVVIEEETEEAEEEPLTDEELIELGYRKVKVLNENGVNVYADTEEDAEVIGHIDFEEELWIKDAEAEGWAEIFTEEEEEAKFVKLDELDKQPLTDEELIELGYRKVQVLNENGVDVYASTEDDAEAIDHIDFKEELWIKDAEAEGWAELYTEEEKEAKFVKLNELDKQPLTDEELTELGYRKVQVVNEEGVDFYADADEEAEVIGHAEYEAELWIKDTEIEGWVEVYSEGKEEAEEEIKQFAQLEEIFKLSDAKMLELGYIKVYVAIDIGANVYESPFAPEDVDEVEEPVDHLDVDTELWVKLVENAERALIYDWDENAPERFISLVDIIAILKPEGMEDLPTRELVLSSSLTGLQYVMAGTTVTLGAELVNFLDDDHLLIKWKYSVDGNDFIEIEGENGLTYEYEINKENCKYTYRISIVLKSSESLEKEDNIVTVKELIAADETVTAE